MYNLKDSSSKFDKPMNKTRVASRECPSRDPISRDLDKTQTILCFISNCNLTEPFQIQIKRELKLNLLLKIYHIDY